MTTESPVPLSEVPRQPDNRLVKGLTVESQTREKAPGARSAGDLPRIAAPAKEPDSPMSLPVALALSVLIATLLVAIPVFAWLAMGWLLGWGVGLR